MPFMKDRMAGTGVWARALRAAARAVLCLALVLLPVAGASAAHFDEAPALALGHDHGSDTSSPDLHAPLCHQIGACYVFVTPAAPAVAPLHKAALAARPDMRAPASAAVHRLFRPPIAAARA